MRKRRRLQRLYYVLWFLSPWNWLAVPFTLLGIALHGIFIRLYRCGSVEGIVLSSYDDKPISDLFVLRTQEALLKFQFRSPAHYRLVRRYLPRIYSHKNIGGGRWDQSLRACHVDFARLAPGLQNASHKDYAFNLACYTARLVQTAAQARLHSLGFFQTKHTWRRHTALSLRVQRRCIKALMGYKDTEKIRHWVRDVDTTWSEDFRRKSLWEKIKLIPQRLSDKR